jgi:hypothetical protein
VKNADKHRRHGNSGTANPGSDCNKASSTYANAAAEEFAWYIAEETAVSITDIISGVTGEEQVRISSIFVRTSPLQESKVFKTECISTRLEQLCNETSQTFAKEQFPCNVSFPIA